MIEKINLSKKANDVPKLFQYMRVGTLNNHMLNVVQAENRTLGFHVHTQSDELFYCIEGAFDIECEDGLVHVSEGDMIIIPKGVSHRPVCKSLVKCLLIEMEGTLDESNTGGSYKPDRTMLSP